MLSEIFIADYSQAVQAARLAHFFVLILEVISEFHLGNNYSTHRTNAVCLQVEDLLMPLHTLVQLTLTTKFQETHFACQDRWPIPISRCRCTRFFRLLYRLNLLHRLMCLINMTTEHVWGDNFQALTAARIDSGVVLFEVVRHFQPWLQYHLALGTGHLLVQVHDFLVTFYATVSLQVSGVTNQTDFTLEDWSTGQARSSKRHSRSSSFRWCCRLFHRTDSIVGKSTRLILSRNKHSFVLS